MGTIWGIFFPFAFPTKRRKKRSVGLGRCALRKTNDSSTENRLNERAKNRKNEGVKNAKDSSTENRLNKKSKIERMTENRMSDLCKFDAPAPL